MKHDVLFFFRQLAERHVGAHAEVAGDVLHQRPHQRLPRAHGAFVNREGVVRYKGAFVHNAHDAGAVTFAARALAVEREFLRGRREKFRTANGAHARLTRRDGQCRLNVVPVRATVACKARVHQAQAVE